MSITRRLTSVLALGLALWDVPPAAIAADGITVLESAADYTFAQQATYVLRAASDADIIQVYLFIQPAGVAHTESINISPAPAVEVNVQYTQDLRLDPLPPFATVTYWWQIDDASGRRLTTDPQSFTYTDNRFQWEERSAGVVTVHWIAGHGDPSFGQAALDIAHNSLETINTELRAPLPETVHIYIYDAPHNLDAAMVLAGRDWIEGQAHPDLGVVVIAVPDQEGYTSRMRHYIPHELTHLLVYQLVTPSAYPYVPEWLDEGLATANESLPTPEYALALEDARAQGQLLPLESLCVPFPPDQQTTLLAYAQSGSVVAFIRRQYGAPAIRNLLAAYAEGASCSAGVQQALGISLESLETQWRENLQPLETSPGTHEALPPSWQTWMEEAGSWIGLWLLGLLAALPMLGGLRRQR